MMRFWGKAKAPAIPVRLLAGSQDDESISGRMSPFDYYPRRLFQCSLSAPFYSSWLLLCMKQIHPVSSLMSYSNN